MGIEDKVYRKDRPGRFEKSDIFEERQLAKEDCFRPFITSCPDFNAIEPKQCKSKKVLSICRGY